MKDIFISYKSEEIAEAKWVKHQLEAKGFSCWMAPGSIPGGSSYAVEIPAAIRACKVFVLVLSAATQTSQWVPKELDTAINHGKTILPFMLENCALKDEFNFYLSNIQRYPAYENRERAFDRMLQVIQAILNPQESTPKTAAQTSEEPAVRVVPARPNTVIHALYDYYYKWAKPADYQAMFRASSVKALLLNKYFMEDLLQFLREREPDKAMFDAIYEAYDFAYYKPEEQGARAALYRYMKEVYGKKTTYKSPFRQPPKQRKRALINKICFIIFTVLCAGWLLMLGLTFADDGVMDNYDIAGLIFFTLTYAIVGAIWWRIVFAIRKKNNK